MGWIVFLLVISNEDLFEKYNLRLSCVAFDDVGSFYGFINSHCHWFRKTSLETSFNFFSLKQIN